VVGEWRYARFKQLRELMSNDGFAKIVALRFVATMCLQE
jgi:hypothetical protein